MQSGECQARGSIGIGLTGQHRFYGSPRIRLSASLFPSEGKSPRAYWETNISSLLL